MAGQRAGGLWISLWRHHIVHLWENLQHGDYSFLKPCISCKEQKSFQGWKSWMARGRDDPPKVNSLPTTKKERYSWAFTFMSVWNILLFFQQVNFFFSPISLGPSQALFLKAISGSLILWNFKVCSIKRVWINKYIWETLGQSLTGVPLLLAEAQIFLKICL